MTDQQFYKKKLDHLKRSWETMAKSRGHLQVAINFEMRYADSPELVRLNEIAAGLQQAMQKLEEEIQAVEMLI